MSRAMPQVARAEGAARVVYLDKSAEPSSSHARIGDLVRAMPPGTRVLDVGCATGMLGRMAAGRGLQIDGLEPTVAWAKAAAPYYRSVVCATLDAAPDAFLAGHDVVVCADVLEHLAHPDEALRRLVGLQPPGARFIVSVPNVANAWVRLNLLLGRFEYAERGILDRTHLRFFTRRSFLDMLARAGLRVTRLAATPVPLGLVHPLFRTSAPGRLAAGALGRLTDRWPTLLGFQFLADTFRPQTEVPHEG